MTLLEQFSLFRLSVEKLASKLPQWNLKDEERRFNSSIFSLYEEAGEISGCVSKYRIRKNNWEVMPDKLENYIEARTKFIDEISDFLWVLVCTCIGTSINDLEFIKLIQTNTEYNRDWFNKFRCIESSLSLLFEALNMYNKDKGQHDYILKHIIVQFGVLLASFEKQYNFTLEDLMEFNMHKLDARYDEKGQRTDGK